MVVLAVSSNVVRGGEATIRMARDVYGIKDPTDAQLALF